MPARELFEWPANPTPRLAPGGSTFHLMASLNVLWVGKEIGAVLGDTFSCHRLVAESLEGSHARAESRLFFLLVATVEKHTHTQTAQCQVRRVSRIVNRQESGDHTPLDDAWLGEGMPVQGVNSRVHTLRAH